MIDATLRLEGLPPLEGRVEVGGDYIRFVTANRLAEIENGGAHRGEIELNGGPKKVALEGVSEDTEEQGKIALTLRRFEPSA